MEGERMLSVSSSLHCVVCVFRCLKNQGEVWELDLQDFYDILFQAKETVYWQKRLSILAKETY
jgi:hypothetical protein